MAKATTAQACLLTLVVFRQFAGSPSKRATV
jgi:hypothetical protein